MNSWISLAMFFARRDDVVHSGSPVRDARTAAGHCEELLQQIAALVFENAAERIEPMIQAGELVGARHRLHARRPSAPARRYTTSPIRACTIAPTHIRHGSTVTYIVAPVSR